MPGYTQPAKTTEWETPPSVMRWVREHYNPQLDVCAKKGNAQCDRYFNRTTNGLKQHWGVQDCWMNPPYGQSLKNWVRKAYDESVSGSTVICLLPVRTDAQWWHDYVMPYGEVFFIRGRLRFGGAEHNAPFPSAIVVFYPQHIHSHYKPRERFHSISLKKAKK